MSKRRIVSQIVYLAYVASLGACAGSPLQLSRMTDEQLRGRGDVELCNAADNMPRPILDAEVQRRGLDCYVLLTRDGLSPKRFTAGDRFLGTWFHADGSVAYSITNVGNIITVERRQAGAAPARAEVRGDTLQFSGDPSSFYKGEIPRFYLLPSGNMFFSSGADDFVVYRDRNAVRLSSSILGTWFNGLNTLMNVERGWSDNAVTTTLSLGGARVDSSSFSMTRTPGGWREVQGRFEVTVRNDGEIQVVAGQAIAARSRGTLLPRGATPFKRYWPAR